MAEKIYTTNEVAEHLRVKRVTVLRYLNTGLLKGIKQGKKWRILDSELQDYLNDLKAQRDKLYKCKNRKRGGGK